MSASAEIDRLRARVAHLETALEAAKPLVKGRIIDLEMAGRDTTEAETVLTLIEQALNPQTP